MIALRQYERLRIYAPINVKPQGGGGGGYSREIDSESFPLGRDFDTWSLQGREFDMASILEDRENMEMSHTQSW